MFVKAHAASNCKEGLQSKKKKKITIVTRVIKSDAIGTLPKYQEFLQQLKTEF